MLVIKNYIKLISKYIWWSRKKFKSQYISDLDYITREYQKEFGEKPNLDQPLTFTEKINWLKLYCHDDLLTACADKYKVREFVRERGCEEILKQLYGVYTKTADINLTNLPNSFALKVNHGCKQQLLCVNKENVDWNFCYRLFDFYLKFSNYYVAREWAYKNILPRIICEEHLNPTGVPFYEYNFYCYDGVPRFVEVIYKIDSKNKQAGMFDINLNSLNREYQAKKLDLVPKTTESYKKMVAYAAKLSEGFRFVRVDLSFANEKIYFGELTFYPLGGIYKFKPISLDHKLGEFLKIPDL